MFTFIESQAFSRLRETYFDDDEYCALQLFLMLDPKAGDVIPGSGGVRKVRWRRPGSGKRGGVRIIYIVRYRPNEIAMLTMYAKAMHEDIPVETVRRMKEAFERDR